MIKVYDAPLANVKYAYVESLKQCKKLYKQLNIPLDKLPDAPCAAHTQTLVNKRVEDGRTITDVMCIVWMVPTCYIGMDIPLLVHEAVHIKQEMAIWMQEDAFSSETEAYIVQGIVENLLREYNTLRGG